MKVSIIGAGRMGRSIGGELAIRGAQVTLYDQHEHTRERAVEILRADLRQLVTQGLLRQSDESAVLQRVRMLVAESLM